jgi:coenzyme F420-0:L-glutamate ligase/coenzyme F420-1:gamma-L-glutamate ligase
VDTLVLERYAKRKSTNVKKIEIIPIPLTKDIKPHDPLNVLIFKAIKASQNKLVDNDILVIAHKIISKAEGRIVNLIDVEPSSESDKIAEENCKDARVVEIILNESKEIVRLSNGIIITETRHGFICANAGVDQSNVEDSFNNVLLLPIDADRSARNIRQFFKKRTGKRIAVIITDTFGRPFREGQTNVAIGVAGIEPIKSYIGLADMYGKQLRVTEIAAADEIASAAELAMGKSARVPAVIIRGYNYRSTEKKSQISKLIRPKTQDLFR